MRGWLHRLCFISTGALHGSHCVEDTILRLMGRLQRIQQSMSSPDSQTSDSVAATRPTVLDAGLEGHKRTKASCGASFQTPVKLHY